MALDTWTETIRLISANYGRDYGGHRYKQNFFEALFALVAKTLPTEQRLDVLEIGSYEGVSLTILGRLLKARNLLGRVVSVDPYYDDGYEETLPDKDKTRIRKDSTPRTMQAAVRLYASAGIPVNVIRGESSEELGRMREAGERFDLVFVDGSHNGLNPLVDTALALRVLKPAGILCLDDIGWPDVLPIVNLLKRHLPLILEQKPHVAFRAPAATV